MVKRIDKPKVFISYAWGDEEYNNAVLSFASDLKSDGVNVLLDRWHLKEGFDTYAFMEKSVSDPEVTNVLILLDPTYAQKADTRSGGVGTETQIISPEVYNQIEQEKFIPVVFKRDIDGSVCKPHYLKGRLHFDLTKMQSYDAEYQRLVKRLYGIDAIKEPELGQPPSWLTEDPLPNRSSKKEEYYKSCSDEVLKLKHLEADLNEVTNQIETFTYDNTKSRIENYELLIPIRNDFLTLLRSSNYVEEGYKTITSVLESMAYKFNINRIRRCNLISTLLHEIFIYTVAYYLRTNSEKALRYILNKTYFTKDAYYHDEIDSYNSFYSVDEELDEEVCKLNEKKFYSGTAEFWMNHIDMNTCNKKEFVFGDVFCYSASYMIRNYTQTWQWFPLTYVYFREDYRSLMHEYSIRLCSKEHLERAAYVMGFNSIEGFIEKFREIEEGFKSGKYREYRYNSAYDGSGSFWMYISSSELGSRN